MRRARPFVTNIPIVRDIVCIHSHTDKFIAILSTSSLLIVDWSMDNSWAISFSVIGWVSKEATFLPRSSISNLYLFYYYANPRSNYSNISSWKTALCIYFKSVKLRIGSEGIYKK